MNISLSFRVSVIYSDNTGLLIVLPDVTSVYGQTCAVAPFFLLTATHQLSIELHIGPLSHPKKFVSHL
jgi:hypothetical protein